MNKVTMEDRVTLEGLYDTVLRFTRKVMDLETTQEDHRLRLQKLESDILRLSKGLIAEQGHNQTPWRGKKDLE